MRPDRFLHQQLEYFLRRIPRARWVLTILLVVLAAFFGSSGFEQSRKTTPIPGGLITGIAKVIDGDSLRVSGHEVRLRGIDAPEGRQTCERNGQIWNCGEESRRELQRQIAGMKVSCKSHERDQHGRLLAVCFVNSKSLNAAMVERGFALAYGDFQREERSAKAAGRGIWSSTFTRPRDWRRQHGIGQ